MPQYENIPFNIAPFLGPELDYIKQAVDNHKICGDGEFTKKCDAWIEEQTGTLKALLTTSCTHALEMAAILTNIQPGDEVIMPSYTFVSTADAFVMRGAKVVFVDIRPDTLNINEKLIEPAITPKTKAIVPVHYAGVGCAMDEILEIARLHNLYVIEDAAQGVRAYYKGKALGSMGEFGCFSFHETKNYSMGEGGAILIREPQFMERAEIIREKGTNRSKFYRGEIDKYSWCDMGSSYLPSDMSAAYLWAQFEQADEISQNRMETWKMYDEAFRSFGRFEVPYVPAECEHNAHMYYIKTKDIEERTKLIAYLQEKNIKAVFHYVPLHSSQAGRMFGRFDGEDVYTTKESERLLRLPLYYNIGEKNVERVIEAVKGFYR
nr:dTDP-4-amino-4,6-dideoxygalactose transaminase [Lachnospiraceae bacterium]